MAKGWFIAGTDTNVGKTRVAAALVSGLVQRGLRVAGMKPVASGCRSTPEGLRSEDAEALMQAANVNAEYVAVNPYVFASAVSPNIAAQKTGVDIRTDVVSRHFQHLSSISDCVVVEGAGGWFTPISDREDVADIAIALGLPVVLVVGMRLGCLNHALLTRAAMAQRDVPFAGWIANCTTSAMPQLDENLAVLAARLGAAPLVVFPYAPEVFPAALVRELARKVA